MDRMRIVSALRAASLLAATALSLSGCASVRTLVSEWFDWGSDKAPVSAPAIAQNPEPFAPAGKGLKSAALGSAKIDLDALESTGSLTPYKPTPVDSEAKNYEAFARDVDKLVKMDLNTPKDVRSAYDQLLKHQPELLSDGWIAYSARMVALDATFAKGVDAEVAANGRSAFMRRIEAEPGYVNKLPGAYDALDHVMKQVATNATKMSQLGDRFIKTAYAFQKKKWGAADGLNKQHFAAAGTADRMMPASFFGLFDSAEEKAAPTGVSQRILVLAASLNAGGPDAGASKSMAHDAELSQCMRWARLNLNQCLAAAHFPSEQAYCTGKHGINEMSACWSQLLPTKS